MEFRSDVQKEGICLCTTTILSLYYTAKKGTAIREQQIRKEVEGNKQ